MNPDVLATLQSIQTSLYILIGLFGLSVASGIVRLWYMTRNDLRDTREDVFRQIAIEFCDKGEFTNLVRHCVNGLEAYPNHALALWFLAKAQIGLKEDDAARQTLGRLRVAEPAWAESHTKPMLSIVDGLTKESDARA